MIPLSVYAEDMKEVLISRDASPSAGGLDSINREIVKKEVELLKLNAEFRSHYTKPTKWKNRRLKFYDAIGGGIANAGDITLMSQFYRYWKDPGAGLAHKGRLEAGPIIVAVAYLTLGSLYAGEGMYDLVSDYRAKRQGFDARSIYKKVVAYKNDLNSLFESRAGLAQNQGPEAVAEGKVLTDIRDLLLIEFSRIYVDSRQQRAARDLTTLGTIGVCATGAAGAFQVVRGVQNVNLKQVGGGGISFLVSGSTLTAAPILIHGGAAVTGKLSADKLKKELGKMQCTALSSLESDVRQLNQMSGSGVSNSNQYDVLCKLLKQRREYLDQADQRKKREIIESFLSYAAKGGPQIAWGTMLTRAGYKYYDNPVKSFRGIAQAATVNEVSWGNWMLDTVQRELETSGAITRMERGA